MFSEQFFDLILNFGDEWNVTKVTLDIKTEEVDVFLEYIEDKAEDTETFELCTLYDHAPSRYYLYFVRINRCDSL